MKNQPPRDVGLELGISVEIERVADELDVIHELLDLDGKEILELGCGRGEHTRAIAAAGTDRRILALEVDETQHAINLDSASPSGVRFGLGGAEDIPATDGSFDVVFMFKSLHHVPVASMGPALAEIARVLRPGGLVYISEPLFRGEFNEVLRIFHDEDRVRRDAFAAITASVQSGALELVSQTFFCAPVLFADFAEFDELVIRVTHSSHVLTDAVRERVRSTFARFEGANGVCFEQPMRVDLLRRPEVVPSVGSGASGD